MTKQDMTDIETRHEVEKRTSRLKESINADTIFGKLRWRNEQTLSKYSNVNIYQPILVKKYITIL